MDDLEVLFPQNPNLFPKSVRVNALIKGNPKKSQSPPKQSRNNKQPGYQTMYSLENQALTPGHECDIMMSRRKMRQQMKTDQVN